MTRIRPFFYFFMSFVFFSLPIQAKESYSAALYKKAEEAFVKKQVEEELKKGLKSLPPNELKELQEAEKQFKEIEKKVKAIKADLKRKRQIMLQKEKELKNLDASLIVVKRRYSFFSNKLVVTKKRTALFKVKKAKIFLLRRKLMKRQKVLLRRFKKQNNTLAFQNNRVAFLKKRRNKTKLRKLNTQLKQTQRRARYLEIQLKRSNQQYKSLFVKLRTLQRQEKRLLSKKRAQRKAYEKAKAEYMKAERSWKSRWRRRWRRAKRRARRARERARRRLRRLARQARERARRIFKKKVRKLKKFARKQAKKLVKKAKFQKKLLKYLAKKFRSRSKKMAKALSKKAIKSWNDYVSYLKKGKKAQLQRMAKSGSIGLAKHFMPTKAKIAAAVVYLGAVAGIKCYNYRLDAYKLKKCSARVLTDEIRNFTYSTIAGVIYDDLTVYTSPFVAPLTAVVVTAAGTLTLGLGYIATPIIRAAVQIAVRYAIEKAVDYKFYPFYIHKMWRPKLKKYVYTLVYNLLKYTVPYFDNASCVSVKIFGLRYKDTLYAGKTYDALVKMRNTGTTTWRKKQSYKLGSQKPQDNHFWGKSRIHLSYNGNVTPGKIKSFKFKIKIPKKGGHHLFSWRMVRDGVHWFGKVCEKKYLILTSIK